jgi:hypothetical protein
MTETEWAACDDGPRMLTAAGGAASDRELRLLACASARLAWSAMPRKGPWAARVLHAVEAAERLADGLVEADDLLGARAPLLRCLEGLGEQISGPVAAAYFAAAPTRPYRDLCALSLSCAAVCGGPHALRRQADLLRDVLGPPRPPAVEPAWLRWDGGAVRAPAEAAYRGRALPPGTLEGEALVVLADAVEEAGGAAELLEHLRSPGPHSVGCWAVDALTGRG